MGISLLSAWTNSSEVTAIADNLSSTSDGENATPQDVVQLFNEIGIPLSILPGQTSSDSQPQLSLKTALNNEATSLMIVKDAVSRSGEQIPESQLSMIVANTAPLHFAKLQSAQATTSQGILDDMDKILDQVDEDMKIRDAALRKAGALQEALYAWLQLYANSVSTPPNKSDGTSTAPPGSVIVAFDVLLAELNKIIQAYGVDVFGVDNGLLFTTEATGDAGKKEAIDWAQNKFGMLVGDESLPPFIRKLDDGHYTVSLDLSPIDTIQQLLTAMQAKQDLPNGPGYLSADQYSALQAAKDADQKTFDANNSKSAQLTVHGSENRDNIVKLISAMIASLASVMTSIWGKL